MKKYQIEKPEEVLDSYNHRRVKYIDAGEASVEIVVQDRTNIQNNDLVTYKTTMVGYTKSNEIDKGWRIGGKYIVQSTVPHRTANILYLEEIQNGK